MKTVTEHEDVVEVTAKIRMTEKEVKVFALKWTPKKWLELDITDFVPADELSRIFREAKDRRVSFFHKLGRGLKLWLF